jgi:hypothetical protein
VLAEEAALEIDAGDNDGVQAVPLHQPLQEG